MRLIINENTTPQYNLALEEYLLKSVQADTLILWRNENAVIIGRNQNAAEEVNAAGLARHKATVTRRMSGGGAVYHDLGNVNFSFIDINPPSDSGDISRYNAPILDFVRGLGVDAVASGRNDLTVDGFKFSGNARYYYKNRMLFHGTLLFDTDLTALGEILNPRPDKYESKGIKSVKARVANLRDYIPMSRDDFWREIISCFSSYMETCPVTESQHNAAATLAAEKYATWQWNYGESPKYSYTNSARFPCGFVEVTLQTKNGIISNCKIYGDFFGKREIAELEQLLIGLPHEVKTLSQSLPHDVGEFINGLSTVEFLSLLD